MSDGVAEAVPIGRRHTVYEGRPLFGIRCWGQPPPPPGPERRSSAVQGEPLLGRRRSSLNSEAAGPPAKAGMGKGAAAPKKAAGPPPKKGAPPKKGGPPPPPGPKRPPPPGKAFPKGKAPSKAEAPPPVEPRKPDVKPGVQVKKLFWNSFRLDNSRNTVWDAIDQEGTPIDTEELELLFAEEPSRSMWKRTQVSQEEAKPQPKINKIKVFPEQRRRQICVMLARLPGGKDETLDAVARMDRQKLSPEQVDLILLNAPQMDEVQMLRKAQQEHTIDELNVWDTAEDFILALLEVPRYLLRLQVWDFENTFQEAYDILAHTNEEINRGCNSLLFSTRIRHLLGITLFAGNHLNGGTSRGRADGFAIDALAQMKLLKMSNGDRQGTLVDFIAQQMNKKYPNELEEVFEEGGEAEQLRRAAWRKLGDAEQELTRMSGRAKQMLRQLEMLQPESAEDELFVRHREVMAMANAELEALQARYKQLGERYAELCVWFAQEANNTKRTSDEFFGIWSAFLTDIQASCKAEKEALKQRRKRSISNQRLRRDRSQTLDLSAVDIEKEDSPAGTPRGPLTPRRGHRRRMGRHKTFNTFLDVPRGELEDRAESPTPSCEEGVVGIIQLQVKEELLRDGGGADADLGAGADGDVETRSPSMACEPLEAEPLGRTSVSETSSVC